MQLIPIVVKNVSVLPYIQSTIPGSVSHIPVEPIIVSANGVYYINPNGTSVNYNLELTGGEVKGEIKTNGTYWFSCEDENGKTITTPWMYCLDGGNALIFGRTVTLSESPVEKDADSH